MKLKEAVLRVLSKHDHYGRCKRCEISWKYRDPMASVEYNDRGSGAFPLCQNCFDAVSAHDATVYFKQLWVGKWNYGTGKDAVAAWETFYDNATRRKES